MEDLVIAKIDVSRPAGRKIIRELERKKSVELEYPMPAGKTIPLRTAIENGYDRLSRHYGVDMKELSKIKL
jgi:hypothetical protein